MSFKRSMAALFAGIAMAASAVFATTPAQAAAPAAPAAQAAGHVATAPAAPPAAKRLALAATSPYTSPSSTTGHVSPGGSWYCEYGNFCALVWDPTRGQWEIFKMYYCNRYNVYYWNDWGQHWNNQTPGTVAYFYNQAGGQIGSAGIGGPTGYTWTPVWSVRNCYV